MTSVRQILEASLIELNKIQAPALKLFEFNYLINKAISQYINKTYTIYDTSQQTSDDLRVLKSSAFLKPETPSLGAELKNSEYTEYYKENGIVFKKFIKNSISDNKLQTKIQIYKSAEQTISDAKNNPEDWELFSETEEVSPLQLTNTKSYSTYEIILPQDYLHLLNCVCIFRVKKNYKCWKKDSFIEVPATRLTADAWSEIVDDVYNRPSPMKPYYYLHNVNVQNELPTGKDEIGDDYNVTSELGEEGNVSNLPRTFSIKRLQEITKASIIDKPIASRVSNTTEVRCEIRCGKDLSIFELEEVHIDYLKSPQHIKLTQNQIDLTEDTSQIMEFPDYVNQEIINELVHLVMERSKDPRLTTHYQMTQSIAKPTEQQATNQN